MKTLQTIQMISKIAKILSKIIFICCIVGFCLCIVGVVGLAVGAPVMKLGGVTFESVLQHNTDMSTGSLYAALAAGLIVCAGEGVLAKFAMHYFDRELKDGTPFTLGGAKELFRLGILSVCIPIGVQILTQIVCTILAKTMTDVETTEMEMGGAVSTGVLFLVMALVCKYGAELNEKTDVPSEGE